MLLYNIPLLGVHSGLALMRTEGSHPFRPFLFSFPPVL